MATYDQFAATLGPTAAPGASPLGAPDAGLLANFAKAGYLNNAAGKQVGSKLVAAQVEKGNQDAQDAYAKQLAAQQASDQAQKLLDSANGKNWQQVQKPDGGYDFYDGTGKKVTVAQYAQATGQDPTKVLAGSKNPLDIQHNNDAQKVDAVVNALANNDQASLQKLAIQIYGDNSKDPTDPTNVNALKKLDALKKLKPGDIYQAFVNFYPHVYGAQAGGLNTGKATSGADTIRPNGAFGG